MVLVCAHNLVQQLDFVERSLSIMRRGANDLEGYVLAGGVVL